MARPLEFDRTVARDRALLVFWRKGYQASSLTDLLTAMEISRSSFYAAFGDKRALFLECLDLFAERTLAFLGASRAADPPLQGLKRFFELGLGRMGEGESHWGCLLVNTSLEMAGVDDALSARASGHLSRVQAAFEASVLRTGCTPQKAADLSAVLMLLLEGLRVSSRRALPAEVQRNQINTAFRILDAAL
jgi:TetR/AcrR family transcriptional repressor of nem operon